MFDEQTYVSPSILHGYIVVVSPVGTSVGPTVRVVVIGVLQVVESFVLPVVVSSVVGKAATGMVGEVLEDVSEISAEEQLGWLLADTEVVLNKIEELELAESYRKLEVAAVILGCRSVVSKIEVRSRVVEPDESKTVLAWLEVEV